MSRQLAPQEVAVLKKLETYRTPHTANQLFEALRKRDAKHWNNVQQVAWTLRNLHRLGLVQRIPGAPIQWSRSS